MPYYGLIVRRCPLTATAAGSWHVSAVPIAVRMSAIRGRLTDIGSLARFRIFDPSRRPERVGPWASIQNNSGLPQGPDGQAVVG
jgi:hypothetical protein